MASSDYQRDHRRAAKGLPKGDPKATNSLHLDRADRGPEMLRKKIFSQHLTASKLAADLGMRVNAGHDLNLVNLKKFASIPELAEVSIGHALIIEALNRGLEEAIHAFRSALN